MITVKKNPENLTPAEWFERFKAERDYIKDPAEEIIIGGVEGIKYKDPRGLDGGSIAVILPQGNNLIDIRLAFMLWDLSEGLKQFPESEKIFNQMISSFKFL